MSRDNDAHKTLAAVLEAFPADTIGTFVESQTISMGLIHQTYKVTTKRGDYILQRLHPKLATEGILQDYKAVLAHLAAADFPAPRLCQTSDGGHSHVDSEGHRWRLTTWCDGQATSTIQGLEMVRSAAALLGQFHATMGPIDYTFQSTHPLHDTPLHLQRMREAAADFAGDPWLAKIQPAIDEVEATLPSLLLDPSLPKRVVHGDPKISNVLFDEQWRAVAMIDLDTCTRHSVLVDLGDAIRSWCRDGSEDQPRPFAIDRCKALLEGYAAAGPALEPEEIALLPGAGRLITLELTARFLADVLRDDYFGWDSDKFASRREHNWARAQSMLALARDMDAAAPALEAIVKEAFSKPSAAAEP